MHSMESTPLGDVYEALQRVRDLTPHYELRLGGEAAGRPTAALRAPEVTAALVEEMSTRIGTDENRVAISTLFFGYCARIWCLGLGTAAFAGRCLDLDPDTIGWSSVGGTLTLHCRAPRPGGELTEEVVDRQLAPLVHAWSGWIADGALWGNAASALRGAGRVLGENATPHVNAALAHPQLTDRLDPRTDYRRSCCLFYRARNGGYCGDCVLAPHV